MLKSIRLMVSHSALTGFSALPSPLPCKNHRCWPNLLTLPNMTFVCLALQLHLYWKWVVWFIITGEKAKIIIPYRLVHMFHFQQLQLTQIFLLGPVGIERHFFFQKLVYSVTNSNIFISQCRLDKFLHNVHQFLWYNGQRTGLPWQSTTFGLLNK